MSIRKDSLKTRKQLTVGNKTYDYFSIKAASAAGVTNIEKLPKSLKVLLENQLRNEDDFIVKVDDIKAIGEWANDKCSSHEINYYPARVMMQDFTGVPAVVDLAAMRDAMKNLGGDAQKINPLVPVDLVIDHSVMIDHYGSPEAFKKNVELEFSRNKERYEFLKWGQGAFQNFRVVPPGTGIIHQVNLEYSAQVVWTNKENGVELAYCDTCVGTDSHTTMINGLSVLGWGVGGIEAEAAMLGQSVTMLIPEVIGFKLKGKLPEGATATDLVLRIVEMLRKKGVVDKFVEFYGDGLAELTLEDRATIANMAPEYGATMGFFPIDERTIEFLTFTNRDKERVALVEAYAKEQGLWRNKGDEPVFTDVLELDMGTIVPALAGPARPQDRIDLTNAATGFAKSLAETYKVTSGESDKEVAVDGQNFKLSHGHVMIAAITSCTNTSNPSVMIAAGLVAKKANALGLTSKPWVKTSIAPGSKVVSDYLEAAGLQNELNALGFNLAGYGCTTCIGNSGPLKPEFSKAISEGNLVASAVLSGNRNFEGRISPDVKANYLASPPLVVAYAIAGSMKIDITKDSLGKDKNGNDVYLKDIWPSNQEISQTMKSSITPAMFASRYSNVFEGPEEWQKIATSKGETYSWDKESTYIKNPPYFEGMTMNVETMQDIQNAKILAIFGDSVTTDHISPAGNIKASSPAGKFLQEKGVSPVDFNSYGARRGNDDIMTRGTFANIRIKNEMMGGVEGGVTKHKGEELSIYDAAMKYKSEGTPLVVFAGKEYGTGSSRDWAAKGTRLQGIKAVVSESFERIHRSNLIGMGVMPLQFVGTNRKELALTGEETISITGISSDFSPRKEVDCEITYNDGSKKTVKLRSRIDTAAELLYYQNGGILHYTIRKLA